MKNCTTCKQQKPNTQFCWKKKNIIREAYCKECKSIKAKRYYKTYKVRKMELETARKKEMRQFLLNYKAENPCVDCGETNPLVLEFDHVGDNKKYTIATMHGNAKETVLKELSKCQVRCASCHAIKTAKDYYKDLIIPKYNDLRSVRAAAPELLESLEESAELLNFFAAKLLIQVEGAPLKSDAEDYGVHDVLLMAKNTIKKATE